MSFTITATKGGGAVEKVPAGNAPAVLVAVLGVGHQHREYKGESKWQNEVYLAWELPTKKKTTGEPHVLATTLNASFNEASTLSAYVEGMTGKKVAVGTTFDMATLLGVACMIQVVHTDKGYPKIKSVAGFPEGLPVPTTTRKGLCLGLAAAHATELPDWLPWVWSNALGKMCSVNEFIGACKEIAGDRAPTPAGSGSDGETTSLGQRLPF